jgi:hypothetical protein
MRGGNPFPFGVIIPHRGKQFVTQKMGSVMGIPAWAAYEAASIRTGEK